MEPSITVCLIALLMFGYLQWARPEGYLRAWTLFWVPLTIRALVVAVRPHSLQTAPGAMGLLANATGELALVLAFIGTARIHRVPARTVRFFWLLCGAAFLATLAGAYGPGALQWLAAILAAMLLAAVVFVPLLRGGLGERLLGLTLLLAGPALLPSLAPALPAWLGQFGFPFAGLCGMGMLLTVWEHERLASERSLRELGVLGMETPLGADSSEARDTERILQTALRRLRRFLPSHPALLYAAPADTREAVVVAEGFSPTFIADFRAHRGYGLLEALDQLGGVADLHGGAARPADPALGRLAQRCDLEGVPGVHTVMFKSRGRPAGFMLVARARWTQLRAGERRVARALARQAGVGMDNRNLYLQSQRRVREFEILTQIGTALSSALDADALLRLIHTQLAKLMDVRNFYVAFQDAQTKRIRFALEFEDGDRIPPRVRPPTNALTEHVIATGSALLIRGDVAEYSARHGLTASGRVSRNWLGVPVVLQGRTCGVIAVQSYDREDAFDREHVHILEILAGQAGVALDNARLFGEVQRDAGQKAFLHHIARLTISTLRPAQVLSTVIEELANAFQYEHIAVATPGKGGSEWAVRAQAGMHRFPSSLAADGGAPSPLGLRVAYAGVMELAPEVAAADAMYPCSRSAVALPLRYSGVTLGVLQIESHQLARFDQDQMLVLRTLADQLAAALHQAILFQQMQHQAITDSLTGLKTRRFFMEALEAEWRRATQAAHAFCIVMLDLDGFKQINDTYGHLEGDRVLQRVARVLEQNCRGSNVVARFGGDEFTILVPGAIPPVDLDRTLPRRLHQGLQNDPDLARYEVRATIGVAFFPDSAATPEELLQAADRNMYGGKRSIARA